MPTTIAGRSTRMEVLELLRRKGDASAETISSDLGVTPNAVRQHLTNLEREGFVVSHPERRRRGRPSLLFSLTERADSVFPKRYGQLASMVLQEVQDMGGPEALDEVFARMASRHAKAIAPTLEGLEFDDKLHRVVAWIGRARSRPKRPRA
jgi:predicted ArsR family transcriptional regulator